MGAINKQGYTILPRNRPVQVFDERHQAPVVGIHQGLINNGSVTRHGTIYRPRKSTFKL